MMEFILKVNHFSDFMATLFSGMSALTSMVLISFVTSAGVLLIFKYASNQKMIKKYKKMIFGYFLELGLFKDQFKRSMGSQLNILLCNFHYLRYFLIPLILMFIPIFILMMQLDFRMGYKKFNNGDTFIVNVKLDKNIINSQVEVLENIQVEPSANVSIDPVPVIIPSDFSISWRGMVKDNSGTQFIKVYMKNSNNYVMKLISPRGDYQSYSIVKKKYESVYDLLFLGEGTIEKMSPFYLVSINNEKEQYSFFGIKFSVLVYYFILTMIFSFIMKPLFKVSF